MADPERFTTEAGLQRQGFVAVTGEAGVAVPHGAIPGVSVDAASLAGAQPVDSAAPAVLPVNTGPDGHLSATNRYMHHLYLAAGIVRGNPENNFSGGDTYSTVVEKMMGDGRIFSFNEQAPELLTAPLPNPEWYKILLTPIGDRSNNIAMPNGDIGTEIKADLVRRYNQAEGDQLQALHEDAKRLAREQAGLPFQEPEKLPLPVSGGSQAHKKGTKTEGEAEVEAHVLGAEPPPVSDEAEPVATSPVIGPVGTHPSRSLQKRMDRKFGNSR